MTHDHIYTIKVSYMALLWCCEHDGVTYVIGFFAHPCLCSRFNKTPYIYDCKNDGFQRVSLVFISLKKNTVSNLSQSTVQYNNVCFHKDMQKFKRRIKNNLWHDLTVVVTQKAITFTCVCSINHFGVSMRLHTLFLLCWWRNIPLICWFSIEGRWIWLLSIV